MIKRNNPKLVTTQTISNRWYFITVEIAAKELKFHDRKRKETLNTMKKKRNYVFILTETR